MRIAVVKRQTAITNEPDPNDTLKIIINKIKKQIDESN